MQALIMAAGLGTRLFPLTKKQPKPMFPIGNLPIIGDVVNLLNVHGITNIIVSIYYLSDMICGYLNNLNNNVIRYSFQYPLVGTAGGLKKAQTLFNKETFIVISSDILTNIDLTALINFHKQKGALATIGLINNDDVSKYGVVTVDDNARIIAFQEKPKPENALSNHINIGVYVFEPEIFDYIPPNEFYDFGKDAFPTLAKLNMPVFGYIFEKYYWNDIGNFECYLKANLDVISNKIKLNRQTSISKVLSEISSHLNIIENSVVGSNNKFEENVIVKNSIVFSNCLISDNVSIENSIIGEGAEIPPNSIIKDCVIAPGYAPIPIIQK